MGQYQKGQRAMLEHSTMTEDEDQKFKEYIKEGLAQAIKFVGRGGVSLIHSKQYNYYVYHMFNDTLNIYTQDGDLVSTGHDKFTGKLTQEIVEIIVKAYVDGWSKGLDEE